MTITLAMLNEVRVINGKAPLKAWKESKAFLVAAYAKEQLKLPQEFETTPDELAAQTVRPKPDDLEGTHEEVAARAARVKAVDDRTHRKAVKSAGKPGTPNSNIEPFTLADVARALGIDPKQARAKARKHLADIAIDKWTFQFKHYDKVVEVLKKGR